MKYGISLLAFVVVLIPGAASAAGLVPCDGPDCNACHAVSMVNGVVNWLVGILSVIAVIGLMIAGFKMVVSGGDTGAWESAKKMFTNIVIGIILILAAWLIVDTVLRMLTQKGGLNEWVGIISC